MGTLFIFSHPVVPPPPTQGDLRDQGTGADIKLRQLMFSSELVQEIAIFYTEILMAGDDTCADKLTIG